MPLYTYEVCCPFLQKKLSHCSNTVIHTLYNTAVSQCYVHQFIAVLDVNLSWPAYRLDSDVYEHFMSVLGRFGIVAVVFVVFVALLIARLFFSFLT